MRTTASLFILGCYAFVSLGASAALIGPALPTLAAKANTGLDRTGLVFVSMSLGYLTSAPIINTLGARMGTRNMLTVSPLVVIGSMALLALGAHLNVFFIATYLLGLGQSGTQVAYNAMFGMQQGRERASAVLNRLNAFFGIGALIGPLLVSASYVLINEATLAFWIAAAMALPLTLGALWARDGLRQPPAARSAAPEGSAARRLLASPVAWGLCVVMGLYVGCEVAFSGWATEFTSRTTGMSTAQAAIVVSIFWAALALSRYFTNVIVSRVPSVTLVSLLFGLAIAGLGVMLLAGQVSAAAWLGAFAVGAGFGPIYPTLIAVGIQRFPFAARMIASVLTSTGSIGALFLPALTGFAMSAPALGAAGAWVMLAGLLALVIGLWQLTRRALAREDTALEQTMRLTRPC
ncbi:MAG: MFS transporter [Anaerolineae bacterium]|nr:MFS transporter [Candidatus Roseilinea sp.]MDW8449945.1 MFS transporter [Anaerolineae bacterium]